MSSIIIRELLTVYGFDVDDEAIKKGDKALKQLKRTAMVVGAAIVGVVGGTTAMAAGFEQAITEAAAKTDDFEGSMEAFEKAAIKAGLESAFSAKEAAGALGLLAQSGLSTAEAVQAVPDVLNLAAAGALELGEATDIATGVMQGFSLTVDDLGRVNDVLAKAANSASTDVQGMGSALSFAAPVAAGLGIELEETAAIIGALADQNIKGSRAGTSLNAILGQMTSVAKDLGVEMTNADLEVLGITGALELLEEAGLDGASALDHFGQRGGPAVAALLSKGTEELREFRGELDNAGGTAEQIAARQLGTLTGAIKILRGTVETMGIRVGQTFLPLATDIARAVQGMLPHIEAMVDEFIAFASAITGIVRKAMLTTFGLLRRFVDAIGGAQRAIALLTFMLGAMGIHMAISTFAAMTRVVWGWVAATRALGAAQAFANAMLAIKPLIIAVLIALVAALIQDFKAFHNQQDSMLGELLVRYPRLGATILTLLEVVGEVFKAFKSLFEFIFTGTSDWDNAFSQLGESIGDFIYDAVQDIKAQWAELKENTSDLVDSIGGFFTGMGDRIRERFAELIAFITDSISSIPGAEMAIDYIAGGGLVGAGVRGAGQLIQTARGGGAGSGSVNNFEGDSINMELQQQEGESNQDFADRMEKILRDREERKRRQMARATDPGIVR